VCEFISNFFTKELIESTLVSTMATPRRTQTYFDFLALPPEVRNMIYDELWKSKNRVAACHGPSRTGILAYYSGMVLDQTVMITERAIRAEEDRDWRPNEHDGLPQWLLANKQILEEDLKQFRLKARWNTWSLIDRWPLTFRDEPKTPEAPLMNPRHARSISLPRMLIKNEEEEFTIWFRYGGIVTFNLRVDDRFWLQHLIHTLGDVLDVRVLHIYIG
jgi:hypothetical protein